MWIREVISSCRPKERGCGSIMRKKYQVIQPFFEQDLWIYYREGIRGVAGYLFHKIVLKWPKCPKAQKSKSWKLKKTRQRSPKAQKYKRQGSRADQPAPEWLVDLPFFQSIFNFSSGNIRLPLIACQEKSQKLSSLYYIIWGLVGGS